MVMYKGPSFSVRHKRFQYVNSTGWFNCDEHKKTGCYNSTYEQ